jgi:hypothetical protein
MHESATDRRLSGGDRAVRVPISAYKLSGEFQGYVNRVKTAVGVRLSGSYPEEASQAPSSRHIRRCAIWSSWVTVANACVQS